MHEFKLVNRSWISKIGTDHTKFIMSKVYSLKAVQVIHTNIDDAWNFFSNPANLAAITPKALGFKIISAHHGETMYAGQLIEYTITPLFGIPVYWMTEITHVLPKQYFIDEQRFGPYSLWHHQHHFKAIAGGVEMTDIVHYRLPFGPFGALGLPLIKKQLSDLFAYRRQRVEQLFGKL